MWWKKKQKKPTISPLVELTVLMKNAKDLSKDDEPLVKKSKLANSETIKIKKKFRWAEIKLIEEVSRDTQDTYFVKDMYLLELYSDDLFYVLLKDRETFDRDWEKAILQYEVRLLQHP